MKSAPVQHHLLLSSLHRRRRRRRGGGRTTTTSCEETKRGVEESERNGGNSLNQEVVELTTTYQPLEYSWTDPPRERERGKHLEGIWVFPNKSSGLQLW